MAQALLKGGIGTFSLGELLQATSLGRQSMMVEVIDRKGKVLGHVRLKGGMVVWAETRKTTGREAFAALLKDPKAHTFIASAISASGANIEVVLIDTQAHKAIDVFYVTSGGAKLTPEQQEKLEAALKAVV